MKTLHINSLGGASGDMLLGLMIALGGNDEELCSSLKSLVPNEHFRIEFEDVVESGLAGRRCRVMLDDTHDHNSHHHSHDHGHRNFASISKMITESTLPESCKELSISIFRALAVAEGKVHGKAPEEVHFHEVGALDSIIDIVGFAFLFTELGIEQVTVSPLPLGTGTTTCQHGLIPVPAPATVELLNGMQVTQTVEPFELVTPTGAAILRTIVTEQGPGFSGSIVCSANSFGHRKLNSRPNLLRGILYQSETETPETATDIMLETNIDDCSPELIGALFDRVLTAGAKDMTVTPVMMKKNRPGFLVSVLTDNKLKSTMETILFEETTTFGIRAYSVTRTMLERRSEVCQTEFGDVKAKIGSLDGRDITIAPEFEDCRRLADQHNVPVREVYRQVITSQVQEES